MKHPRPRHLLFVLGTRPEALKLAPLLLKAQQCFGFRTQVCLTAQHREMVDSVLRFFRIRADFDLNLMHPDQDLADLTARVLESVRRIIRRVHPDLLIIQGDTTTAFTAALAAFYEKIPIAHVEAGLRSHHKYHPFPEEMNRTLITHLADYHFAPTAAARRNLLKEGIDTGRIFVTGNTIVDTLMLIRPQLNGRYLPLEIPADKKLILVTAHRRESLGIPLRHICRALRTIARRNPSTEIVYPVHLNPRVRQTVIRELGGRKIRNIHLIEPLSYEKFIALLSRCDVALTDSGGIQEEAPSLGKPVLVMRNVTERKEGLKSGSTLLVGTDPGHIVKVVSKLLNDPAAYRRMVAAKNPYGDGKASERILRILSKIFILTSET